jgi:N-6 DNA Methylase
MTNYQEYRQHLDLLLAHSQWGRQSVDSEGFHAALNGGAAEALRRQIGADEIAASGAYFTGEDLARSAVRVASLDSGSLPVIDPSCGAGDLLLRWSEALPVEPSLAQTVKHWGKLLYGWDIHPEFVQVAKRRLLIAAIARGCRIRSGQMDPDACFPHLVTADFQLSRLPPRVRTIVLNPPFKRIYAPASVAWASGKVSTAAVFLSRCLEQATPGTRVVAILPEALRSGSSYQGWRDSVATPLGSARVLPMGQFSASVEMDVFVLDGVTALAGANCTIQWSKPLATVGPTIESICEVTVGSVVPNRTPEVGPAVSYYTTAELSPWTIVAGAPTRRVPRPRLMPPLVAVRRTSSPADRDRPAAAIITGMGPIALENHLIALQPHDGQLETCQRILATLQQPYVRRFIDNVIRCRHLTVSALRQIPLSDPDHEA